MNQTGTPARPIFTQCQPCWVAGARRMTDHRLQVRDKYTGELSAEVALAGNEEMAEAIAAAVGARRVMAAMPSWRRRAALAHVVSRMERDREKLALLLALEVGKPICDARGEVQRGIDTFTLAMEEATRLDGAVMTLDVTPRAEGFEGYWKRVPVGAVALISPFNFPINLVAHKVAPAIAAGCPFVLKPASSTPLTALALGEYLEDSGLPAGAFSIVPASRTVADHLVTDGRLGALSFTGSPEVGWDMKARCGRKRITLELGGDAACIVDESAEIDRACERIVFGAYYQSGQSCISVQRILVHQSRYEVVRDRLVALTAPLVSGDPFDERTFIGPLITEADARRLEEWIQEAVRGGARVLCGGEREGSMLAATLLEGVRADASISCREAFGPVATIEPVRSMDEAFAVANASRYGLQAGIFTDSLDVAQRAVDELEVGGVIINDVPSMRIDRMPYGGVKESGHGREGVRFAVEDMTEMRLAVWRKSPRRTAAPNV